MPNDGAGCAGCSLSKGAELELLCTLCVATALRSLHGSFEEKVPMVVYLRSAIERAGRRREHRAGAALHVPAICLHSISPIV